MYNKRSNFRLLLEFLARRFISGFDKLIIPIITGIPAGVLVVIFQDEILKAFPKPREWVCASLSIWCPNSPPPPPAVPLSPTKPDMINGWIYAGAFASPGAWEKPRLKGVSAYSPKELAGKTFEIQYPDPVSVRNGPFREIARVGTECSYDPTNSTVFSTVSSGSVIKIVDVKNICNGYIWIRIEFERK